MRWLPRLGQGDVAPPSAAAAAAWVWAPPQRARGRSLHGAARGDVASPVVLKYTHYLHCGSEGCAGGRKRESPWVVCRAALDSLLPPQTCLFMEAPDVHGRYPRPSARERPPNVFRPDSTHYSSYILLSFFIITVNTRNRNVFSVFVSPNMEQRQGSRVVQLARGGATRRCRIHQPWNRGSHRPTQTGVDGECHNFPPSQVL